MPQAADMSHRFSTRSMWPILLYVIWWLFCLVTSLLRQRCSTAAMASSFVTARKQPLLPAKNHAAVQCDGNVGQCKAEAVQYWKLNAMRTNFFDELSISSASSDFLRFVLWMLLGFLLDIVISHLGKDNHIWYALRSIELIFEVLFALFSFTYKIWPLFEICVGAGCSLLVQDLLIGRQWRSCADESFRIAYVCIQMFAAVLGPIAACNFVLTSLALDRTFGIRSVTGFKSYMDWFEPPYFLQFNIMPKKSQGEVPLCEVFRETCRSWKSWRERRRPEKESYCSQIAGFQELRLEDLCAALCALLQHVHGKNGDESLFLEFTDHNMWYVPRSDCLFLWVGKFTNIQSHTFPLLVFACCKHRSNRRWTRPNRETHKTCKLFRYWDKPWKWMDRILHPSSPSVCCLPSIKLTIRPSEDPILSQKVISRSVVLSFYLWFLLGHHANLCLCYFRIHSLILLSQDVCDCQESENSTSESDGESSPEEDPESRWSCLKVPCLQVDWIMLLTVDTSRDNNSVVTTVSQTRT